MKAHTYETQSTISPEKALQFLKKEAKICKQPKSK
jgi:hypothetical protein